MFISFAIFFFHPATATRQLLSVCCGLGEEKSTRLSEGQLRPNQMLSRMEIPRHLHARGRMKVPGERKSYFTRQPMTLRTNTPPGK